MLSSFSTDVWYLVMTQGVLAALGCALVYSPTTLSLSEWYTTGNRTLALGITLSCKNIVGSTCPFLFRLLLGRYGLRMTLRIRAGIATGSSLCSIALVPSPRSTMAAITPRETRIPRHFLVHRTFYIYSVAIVLQSCGYGIPQIYLNTYTHDVVALSQTSATLVLTLFKVPGICSSFFFGYLSEKKRLSLSATSVRAISAISSALAAFVLWGLSSEGGLTTLNLFSISFGFFAECHSATWGGMLNGMEQEAAQSNEAIDSGMIYGLLNGARAI